MNRNKEGLFDTSRTIWDFGIAEELFLPKSASFIPLFDSSHFSPQPKRKIKGIQREFQRWALNIGLGVVALYEKDSLCPIQPL